MKRGLRGRATPKQILDLLEGSLTFLDVLPILCPVDEISLGRGRVEVCSKHYERQRNSTLARRIDGAVQWQHVELERVLQRLDAGDDQREQGSPHGDSHEVPYCRPDAANATYTPTEEGSPAVVGVGVLR